MIYKIYKITSASTELKDAVADIQADVSNDLINHENYKQFVCDETLNAIDSARFIFAGTHISFQVISVILAATVTALHYASWSGAETAGIIIGAVHTVTLVVFNFIQPNKTTTELQKMKSWAMGYAATKAHMPAHILHDMMQVNTWCMKHPLITTDGKKEIDQRLQKAATKTDNKADSSNAGINL